MSRTPWGVFKPDLEIIWEKKKKSSTVLYTRYFQVEKKNYDAFACAVLGFEQKKHGWLNLLFTKKKKKKDSNSEQL